MSRSWTSPAIAGREDANRSREKWLEMVGNGPQRCEWHPHDDAGENDADCVEYARPDADDEQPRSRQRQRPKKGGLETSAFLKRREDRVQSRHPEKLAESQVVNDLCLHGAAHPQHRVRPCSCGRSRLQGPRSRHQLVSLERDLGHPCLIIVVLQSLVLMQARNLPEAGGVPYLRPLPQILGVTASTWGHALQCRSWLTRFLTLRSMDHGGVTALHSRIASFGRLHYHCRGDDKAHTGKNVAMLHIRYMYDVQPEPKTRQQEPA